MREKSGGDCTVDVCLLGLELVIKDDLFVSGFLLGAVEGMAEEVEVELDELYGHVLGLSVSFGWSCLSSVQRFFLLRFRPHRRFGFTNKINILSMLKRKI